MKIFKIFIVAALVLFFVVHISCTLLYTLPSDLTHDGLADKAKIYMAPVFDQSWSLFAPIPEVNKRVYISYLNEKGEWLDWEAPFDKYLSTHQSNPLSASGKLVLMQSSTLHYLYEENKASFVTQSIIKGDTSSGYFKVLRYSVVHEIFKKEVPQKMKIMVSYETIDTTKRKYCIYYPEL